MQIVVCSGKGKAWCEMMMCSLSDTTVSLSDTFKMGKDVALFITY